MRLFFPKHLTFLILVALLSLSAYGAGPDLPSVYVDSDQYTSHANQTADLSGHVKFIRDAQQITCDRAHVDTLNNEIVAEGNVVLIGPTQFIKAEKLTYNFKTQKGIIENGFLQIGQQTIEGEQIAKVGDSEYEAKNATYTSCINCPPSWKVSGSSIRATIGEYAYIKRAVIRLYGVPVLWLPYAALPIKSKRQSGLLAPSFGFGSSNGFNLGESYFLAINDNKDVTLTETSYAARGLKTGLEYRFVSDRNSSGHFNGNFINDGFFSGDPTFSLPDPRYVLNQPRIVSNAIPRYSLHYEHHYELPDNYVSNMNLNVVSDTRYPVDFPLEVLESGDSALENRISLTKNSENTHSSVDVDLYENLLKGDPTGQNGDAVHRLPELQYTVLPQRIWGDLQASLDANYVNFFRAGPSYDEVNSAGNTDSTRKGFNPTLGNPTLLAINPTVDNGQIDRYRTGERLIVKPSLSYPFNVGDILEVLPSVTYEEDYYQFGYGDPANGVAPQASRRWLHGTISVRTRMSSVFTLGSDLKSFPIPKPGTEAVVPPEPQPIKFKHEIIPEITYTTVPYLYQDQHPFFLGAFTNSNNYGGTYFPHFNENQPVTEFEALQFDYRDRLSSLNLMTFGLSNILIEKAHNGDVADYKPIIRHRLTQSFDFYTAYGPDSDPSGHVLVKQPWSEIHSLLDVHIGFFDVTSDLSYYNYQNLSGQVTSLGVHSKKGDIFGVSYAESYGTQISPSTGLIANQVDPRTRSEVLSFKAYFTSKIADAAAVTSYDLLNHDQGFISYLVYALLRPPGRCWGLSGGLQYTLGGRPNFFFSIPFFFGEDNSVPRPPGV